jgi:ABC-type iron transport system FetAB permease component
VEALASLTIALFLAMVANRLVEALIVPLYEHYQWDRFSLLYVAWLVAGLLVLISGVNLFEAYLPSPLAGQILTAIVAGGGANFIADIFSSRGKSTPS